MSMTLFELSLHENEEMYAAARDKILQLKQDEPRLSSLRWDRVPMYNMRMAQSVMLQTQETYQ